MARKVKRAKKRRKYSMARRRYARTRTIYRKARRSYARRGGSFKPIIDGVLGGVASNVGSKYLGSWGSGLGYLAVGMFRKNSTLSTLGGVQLGTQIGSMLPFIGGGGNGNGGFFQS